MNFSASSNSTIGANAAPVAPSAPLHMHPRPTTSRLLLKGSTALTVSCPVCDHDAVAQFDTVTCATCGHEVPRVLMDRVRAMCVAR